MADKTLETVVSSKVAPVIVVVEHFLIGIFFVLIFFLLGTMAHSGYNNSSFHYHVAPGGVCNPKEYCNSCGGVESDGCFGQIKCEPCPKICPPLCKTVYRFLSDQSCSTKNGNCKKDENGSNNPYCFYAMDIQCDKKTILKAKKPKCVNKKEMEEKLPLCL